MKKLMLVSLALSIVLVGCGERDDGNGAKEKQNVDEELQIKAEDYMEFKENRGLGTDSHHFMVGNGT